MSPDGPRVSAHFCRGPVDLGDVDWSILEAPTDRRDDLMIREMHRLEHQQANYLLDKLGQIPMNGRLLDGGSGRGGTSLMAHDLAMQRMVQAGVVPVTWQQVMLEWQRDWARKETYDAVTAIVKEHSGAYGMGIDYAYTMVHKAEQRPHGNQKTLAPVPAK